MRSPGIYGGVEINSWSLLSASGSEILSSNPNAKNLDCFFCQSNAIIAHPPYSMQVDLSSSPFNIQSFLQIAVSVPLSAASLLAAACPHHIEAYPGPAEADPPDLGLVEAVALAEELYKVVDVLEEY